MSLRSLTQTAGGIALVAVAVASLNIIGARLNGRVDITEESLYTLSEGSKNILADLQRDVKVNFYFSKSLKDVPPFVRTYATRVEELLREYAAHSDGRLTVEALDPKPDTDIEVNARKYGLRPVPQARGGELFLGAVFFSGTEEEAIPFFDPRREEFLEYDVSEVLTRLSQKDKPKVGIMTSLPMFGSGGLPMQQNPDDQPWMIVQQLRRTFEVVEVETDAAEIDDDIGVLMVMHPKKLSEGAQFAIDQFVVRGGRLVLAVDPLSRIDLAQAAGQQMMMGRMPEASSDLPRLLKAWGVTYKPSEVVGDALYQTRVNRSETYPLYLSLVDEALSEDSIITGQLNSVMLGEPGALEQAAGSDYTFEPLLVTSDDSGTVAASMVTMSAAGRMSIADISRELKTDGKQRTLAALVQGTFKSAFDSAPEPPKSEEDEEGEEAPEPLEHTKEGTEEAVIMVIADTDFVHDDNAVRKRRLLNMVMAEPINDNLPLILNTVEFLGGDENLISIRSRGKVNRPFKVVMELQRQAQIRYKDEEERLSEELRKVQQRLNELQRERTDGSRFTLTAQQQAEVAKFREREADVRRRRREVRKNLREEIESLGQRLPAANMVIVPLAVSLFGLGMFRQRLRSRRRKGKV